ncbi:hypothetical protein RchiOBHm_Chr1g0347001 [Rosa chinensis]|uniref:Uncharacterized protein n=1 Tax=Rosa chinensis TaxID=74649 RepID=A0A2P6SF59_ROSCH|nr:hypothetical protein RchiOBHm_Chr1g0347001 [Rosa chinensis]
MRFSGLKMSVFQGLGDDAGEVSSKARKASSKARKAFSSGSGLKMGIEGSSSGRDSSPASFLGALFLVIYTKRLRLMRLMPQGCKALPKTPRVRLQRFKTLVVRNIEFCKECQLRQLLGDRSRELVI